MPFDDEDNVEQKKGFIGVKGADKSRFSNVPKKPNPNQFSEAVSQKEKQINQQATDFFNITKNVVSLFRDKTLKQNKNTFSLSLENEIIQKFIDKCADRNDDEDAEFNGEGSLTAISLLIKLCLEQRDKINELEYKIKDIDNYEFKRKNTE